MHRSFWKAITDIWKRMAIRATTVCRISSDVPAGHTSAGTLSTPFPKGNSMITACDRKVSGSAGPGRKRPGDRIHRCMDDVSEVRQWTSPLPSGERLETVWCPDQQDNTCQLDHLLLQELLSANV